MATVPMGVNARMVKHSMQGAALAALLSFSPAVAQEEAPQQPTVAARIAEAKLKEARGELAAAETLLQKALAQASGDEKQQVATQLAALLQRQGKVREAEQLLGVVMTENVDPLDEEVMMLDRDLMSETVDVAKQELAKLGPLAVPALLKALPKFGPFGLTNALEVLGGLDDPRIGPALVKVAEVGDPSVALTLAQKAASMQRGVALALAQCFAEAKRPVAVQLGALQALLAYAPTEPATRDLALRLAADPTGTAQAPLIELFAKREVDYRVQLYDLLRSHGSPEVQADATRRWLLLRPELGEAEALAALAKLPAATSWWSARDLAMYHPDWVKVALLALRGAGRLDDRSGQLGSQFVNGIEWWRAPDESAPELLRTPCAGTSEARSIGNAIGTMAARGWHLPPELDAACAAVMVMAHDHWRQFVAALPADAEPRALAAWQEVAPVERIELVLAAIFAERPWHRLVAQQLATARVANQVNESLLARDWSGAGAEAVAVLAELAQRWPEDPSGRSLPWHQELVSAYGRCPDLPATVLLPMALHNTFAFSALSARDPEALLAYLRGKELSRNIVPSQIVKLLKRSGGSADLGLALRALDMSDTGVEGSLIQFLATYGGGNLDLIRMGMHASGPRGELALFAARHARVEDLDALLAMLPDLVPSCAGALVNSLMEQVRAQHGESLVRAADALLAAPMTKSTTNPPVEGNAGALGMVLRLLQRAGDRRALDLSRRVLARANLSDYTHQIAAITAVTVAGSEQRAVVLELLASTDQAAVQVALTAEVLRDDAAVQGKRREAILRLGDCLCDVDNVFAAFDEKGKIALAEAVLASERFRSYCSDLAKTSVWILGQLKDPGHIPQFVAAARHPAAIVRVNVAAVLGLTFSREAAPQLIEMLKDEETTVRKTAQTALDELANYLDAKAKWEARLK